MKNNNKYKIWFLSSLIIFIGIVIGLYIRQQEVMKSYSLLHDRMSYPVLYAINTGKLSEAKKMLSYNLVNLVLNYDKDVFSNSKSLSSFCNDWNKDIKHIVLEVIEHKSFDNTAYQKNIIKNINVINLDCK